MENEVYQNMFISIPKTDEASTLFSYESFFKFWSKWIRKETPSICYVKTQAKEIRKCLKSGLSVRIFHYKYELNVLTEYVMVWDEYELLPSVPDRVTPATFGLWPNHILALGKIHIYPQTMTYSLFMNEYGGT